MNCKNIFISAGDVSGDIHACNLVKEIKRISPSCYITAIGGKNLQKCVDHFIIDIVSINAFGFFPLKQVIYLQKVFKQIKIYLYKTHTDKIILIDFYGFNIHIAKLAKKMDIPVYYYIGPQVWASRKYRIKKLARVITKMFVIFPFEEKIYKEHGLDTTFVGNPILDIIPRKQYQYKCCKNLNQIVIGLFPGSRMPIIKRHIPILLDIMHMLKQNLQMQLKFILFNTQDNLYQIKLMNIPKDIEFATSNNLIKRQSIDFAICTSGTVSLENVLMHIPMIVMYKLSYLDYFIIKSIIKVKYITIANIIANKLIVPEFIQFEANAHKIVPYIIKALKPENYKQQIKVLNTLRMNLGNTGAAKRVAKMILND
ncbi:MAG: lipid-A-disaccharide synthase [Endomicrobium sp.]|jgi:lipid-A-disaccharide synthase|nr:lipid-A-disaccharide synthase [Endomicrobium sp.]